MKALAPIRPTRTPDVESRRPAGHLVLRPPGDRLALVTVGMALAWMPMLNPKGPFNTAPVDVFIVAAIAVVVLWAATVRAMIRVPYALTASALAATGLFAALASVAPMRGLVAVVQEAFLLAWCAAIVTVGRTPRALGFVVRGWCLSTAAWSAVIIATVIAGLERVPGGSGGVGHRARLWFDHPNLAANYLLVSLFVMLAARQPRGRLAHAVAVFLVLVAIVLTGSNSALSFLPVGGVVILYIRTRHSRGPLPAVAVSLLLVLGLGATWTFVGQPMIARAQEAESSLIRHSVGRGEKSANARVALFASQYEIFAEGNLIGIGPAATAQVLDERRAEVAKTPHNDYLATLVERGLLGVVALAGLIAAIFIRVVSVQTLSPQWLQAIPNPPALAAACLGCALTAITHEVLHYRHFWALLAVIAALYVGSQDAGPPSLRLVREP